MMVNDEKAFAALLMEKVESLFQDSPAIQSVKIPSSNNDATRTPKPSSSNIAVSNEPKKRKMTASEDISSSQAVYQFDKKEFLNLHVVGQFNKGFIVASSDDVNNSLIIVDQHAADERYNFETLTGARKIQLQRLVEPITLNLGIQYNLMLELHAKMLAEFGFLVRKDLERSVFKLETIPSD